MVFDEEAALAAVAALAQTTDEEMVADICAAVELLAKVWGAWRGGREYPLPRHPARRVADARGEAVVAALNGVRALTSRSDLTAAINTARPPLSQVWPERRPGERSVAVTVDRLRYQALIRPRLVRDARAITADPEGFPPPI